MIAEIAASLKRYWMLVVAAGGLVIVILVQFPQFFKRVESFQIGPVSANLAAGQSSSGPSLAILVQRARKPKDKLEYWIGMPLSPRFEQAETLSKKSDRFKATEALMHFNEFRKDVVGTFALTAFFLLRDYDIDLIDGGAESRLLAAFMRRLVADEVSRCEGRSKSDPLDDDEFRRTFLTVLDLFQANLTKADDLLTKFDEFLRSRSGEDRLFESGSNVFDYIQAALNTVKTYREKVEMMPISDLRMLMSSAFFVRLTRQIIRLSHYGESQEEEKTLEFFKRICFDKIDASSFKNLIEKETFDVIGIIGLALDISQATRDAVFLEDSLAFSIENYNYALNISKTVFNPDSPDELPI